MGGNRAPLAFGALLAMAVMAGAPPSRAGFVGELGPPDPATAPAVRYAQLDRASCEAELRARSVPFAAVDEARGVLAPVRLTGPLHGVTFRTALPAAQRGASVYEIVDCRLALALDDFAGQLAAHDVVEVVHFSMYRPPAARWKPPPTSGGLGSRHPGALAIDAATFVKKDGTSLRVERDFHGRIGAPTCGVGAGPRPASPESRELRAILCDAADARLFNVVLTPDFNWPHRNHFHLEVTAGARWFVVH